MWGVICIIWSGVERVAEWWDHSPPINVAILLRTAVGKGVGSHLHNLIGNSKSGADWWENSPTINVAIRLKRAVGIVVRGYLLNQIRGSKSGAVVQALSSHQCSHPTGKSSQGRRGGGVVRGYLHNQIRAGGNVARVQIPTSTPYIIWVCCYFSPLLREDFSPGTSVFYSPQKPTMTDSYSIWNARTRSNEFLRTPKYSVGKHITTFKLQFRWFS